MKINITIGVLLTMVGVVNFAAPPNETDEQPEELVLHCVEHLGSEHPDGARIRVDGWVMAYLAPVYNAFYIIGGPPEPTYSLDPIPRFEVYYFHSLIDNHPTWTFITPTVWHQYVGYGISAWQGFAGVGFKGGAWHYLTEDMVYWDEVDVNSLSFGMEQLTPQEIYDTYGLEMILWQKDATGVRHILWDESFDAQDEREVILAEIAAGGPSRSVIVNLSQQGEPS